jgi:predicted TIM-barrel fold metal-dependent hydrolase
MAAKYVISADSHMMEPANLWVERLDAKYKDEAPRVVKSDNKGDFLFVAPGIPSFPVAGGFAAGRSGQELKDFLSEAGQDKGYEAARPSGWDPAERLKDQDIDGVHAEVLYTTLGMPLFGLHDTDLQRACFRAYNDWVAEFASHSPKRLHAIALVSLEDIGEGVKELRRAAKIGLKGAMIWGSPPREKPYYLKDYDPFWAAAEELEMPLSLHVITGKRPPKSKEEREKIRSRNPDFTRGYMSLIHEVQRSLTDIIFGGVMMRFPKIRIVSAEFQDDPIGPALFKFFGEDRFMWASDFPHTDSTWPHSLDVIKKDFAGVPENVTQKIICDNAAELYHIDLN